MESSSHIDDFSPTFYVGQHESRRSLPVSDSVLRQAQDCGYDMLTTPITTANFHSRVLALLSSHLSQLQTTLQPTSLLAPVIPPLSPVDTPLAPNHTISQLLAVSSSWIDLCSPDPVIANISRQVLTLEIAYAGFCGIGNVIIPGPKLHNAQTHVQTSGLAQYARAISEALSVGTYVQISIQLPMVESANGAAQGEIGDLAPFARDEFKEEEVVGTEGEKTDLFGVWDAWNIIRSVCKYNPRLFVALTLPRQLPPVTVQNRWFAEPLRLLTISSSIFLRNPKGYPVLSKSHQALLSRYMRLHQPPWLLLSDVGAIPGLDDPTLLTQTANGFLTPSATADASASPSPTPAEASDQAKENGKFKVKPRDPTPHLSYIRHLQRNQPRRTTIERFGAGYQDFLQAPLQPLADNLESVTYEVFEKDPVKYDWYERAITAALTDWAADHKPTSGADGAIVVAVVGAGRGPLVTRALRASERTGIPIEMWAVEKNPNAYVMLQRHNEETWGGRVTVVKSDMRLWRGPLRSTVIGQATSTDLPTAMPTSYGVAGSTEDRYGHVDILISELLGSFADNELSPECLDGVQHVLAPVHGISIPSSYAAHLTPVLAPRLFADISSRAATDATATELPYVVMLHAIDILASSTPSCPAIQQAWEFSHPLPSETLSVAEARRGGGVSGGGVGSMAGGDGANEHNARYARLKFHCKDRGVVHGLGGYFEAVLYKDIELSTRPDTIDRKSPEMISWFPIFFPLKTAVYFPDNSEVEVSIWRQTDDRKVWYEWLVEAFATVVPGKRFRVGLSELGSSRKNGCLM